MLKRSVLLFVLSLFIAAPVMAAHYEIDADHSSISFKVRHLISKTAGKFTKFKGSFDFEPGKSDGWKTEVVAQAGSIDTDNQKRDEHLRSEDFFDVKKYPTLKFVSKSMDDVEDDSFELKGDLTMHGVTKLVKFDVEIGGTGTDPWGNKKAGFTAKTKINRKDFGIIWNKNLDAGGVMLGDEVEVVLEIEGNMKEVAAKKK